jgi:D-alanyl-D-alanine carboxypeptidase (penicillin-binding protein 5/6)
MKAFRLRRAAGILAACFFFVAITLTVAGYISARSRISALTTTTVSAAEESMARSAWRASGLAPELDWPDAPGLSSFRGGLAGSAANDAGETDTADAVRVHARSAIVIDAATGSVLLEKNADERIPPASMTKLVAMYTAFRAAEAGEISLDDTVDLPAESWAVNIPAGSSLMFLAEGQHVTVRELLTGMATVSGNDAAIALAHHVADSVDSFVSRMNAETARLGLAHTTFVEPSGLSENNMTSAREFADFSRTYVSEYPEALKAFHSRTSLSYPMEWNIPAGSDERPIVQHATNRLLGVLPGCDGLKTGFIYESGYNMTLTAERNGTRFISVTMGGPGNGSAEGSALRSEDGTALMEWAFANFRTVRPEPAGRVMVAVFGGAISGLNAIPATGSNFTIRKNDDSTSGDSTSDIGECVATTTISPWLEAPVRAGDVIGSVTYMIDGQACHEVQLIADRNAPEGSLLRRAFDAIALVLAPLAR